MQPDGTRHSEKPIPCFQPIHTLVILSVLVKDNLMMISFGELQEGSSKLIHSRVTIKYSSTLSSTAIGKNLFRGPQCLYYNIILHYILL